MVSAGYDPIYGARPMKRYLQSKLETLIARELLASDPAPGTELVADAEGGELCIRLNAPRE